MNKKIFEQRSVADAVLARKADLADNMRRDEPNAQAGFKGKQPGINPTLLRALAVAKRVRETLNLGRNLDIRA